MFSTISNDLHISITVVLLIPNTVLFNRPPENSRCTLGLHSWCRTSIIRTAYRLLCCFPLVVNLLVLLVKRFFSNTGRTLAWYHLDIQNLNFVIEMATTTLLRDAKPLFCHVLSTDTRMSLVPLIPVTSLTAAAILCSAISCALPFNFLDSFIEHFLATGGCGMFIIPQKRSSALTQ